MKAMQKGLRDKILERDGNICVRFREGTCRGRKNTIEHVFGRKNEELWNCITLCAYHHSVDEYQDGGGLNKEINKYYAYKNVPDAYLLKNYKLGQQMVQEKHFLRIKYEKLLSM